MITKTQLDKLPFVSVRGVRYVDYEALRELLKEDRADDNGKPELVGQGSESASQSETSKRAK
jgi:hypothetical protein